jgi:hypothetical protein
MGKLNAWKKGDHIKMLDGRKFVLTSDGYFDRKQNRVVCDTDQGCTISYLSLIEEAKLVK